MKRLVLMLGCLVGAVGEAGGVDDALKAVQEAQRAAEDGACKGLSTKLKLALEAVEHAQKAPKRGVVLQAKGRVEAARDAVAQACTDAAKPKVTQQLEAAMAALEKAAEPVKVEHQGAPLEAACRANDECASEHCYVGPSDKGYCSKTCEAVADCPPSWQCRRVGSLPEKFCVK